MWQRSACLGITIALLSLSVGANAANNMRLHGTLVAQPCVIAPGDELVKLDFGTVIDKHLYFNQRSPMEEFRLHLSKCDLSLGTTVQVTLSGDENPRLPGLVALDATSEASGIGIGIETDEGKAVPLNRPGERRYSLTAGDNYLRMQAYVQGEPQAIANHTINRGPFKATVTFALSYD